jgi:glycosyltransferase involved in cell wall biosynthesis
VTDHSDAASTPQPPLTILIGCDTFPPNVNGAANFAARLAAGLVERGHQVHIVAPSADRKHGTWVEEHEGQRMVVHRLPSYRWPFHDWLRFAWPFSIRRRSAAILDEVRPDVVHFQSHIVVGRGLAVEAQKRGIRLIGTNHTMPDNLVEFVPLPQSLKDLLVRSQWKAAERTFRKAFAVTTPTRRAAEFLERNTQLRGVYAISCGIDAHYYTPDFAPRTGNRVMFVGRIVGEKRIDVLLHALALMPAELEVTLEIIGDGDQRKALQHLATQLGVDDRTTFTGYVPDEEIRKAYTHAGVLAMPSTAELQSIVTMEAMASGLPVVAADAMALPHLVHDGENGYLFTPGDAHDLAEKLTRILTLPEAEFTAMKNASLNLVTAHDIQRTLTTFEALYRGETVPSLRADDPASAAAAPTRAPGR